MMREKMTQELKKYWPLNLFTIATKLEIMKGDKFFEKLFSFCCFFNMTAITHKNKNRLLTLFTFTYFFDFILDLKRFFAHKSHLKNEFATNE
jgi:hypothetical protein